MQTWYNKTGIIQKQPKTNPGQELLMFLTFKPLLEQKEEEKIFDIKYDLIIDH